MSELQRADCLRKQAWLETPWLLPPRLSSSVSRTGYFVSEGDRSCVAKRPAQEVAAEGRTTQSVLQIVLLQINQSSEKYTTQKSISIPPAFRSSGFESRRIDI